MDMSYSEAVFTEEQLYQEAEKIVAQLGEKSVFWVKTQLECLVLEHGPLFVEKEEKFVHKIGKYKILENFRNLRVQQVKEKDCPDAAKNGTLLSQTGSATSGFDSSHIGPDWDFLMEQGLPGVMERLRENRKNHSQPEMLEYYDRCLKVYDSFLRCLNRWADQAQDAGNTFVAENLRQLCVSAPQTLAQAMQLTVVFTHFQTHLDMCAVRSLGGLDHLYQPFYQKALDAGETEEQLRSLTSAFLQRLHDLHMVANAAFYICDTQGNSYPYTWILLEEYRKLDLFDLKLHVMYHPALDKDLVRYILDSIRGGKNSFVFLNTDAAQKALVRIGVAPEDAKRLTVYGCYEYAAEGTEVPCTCGSYVNMAKAVELTVHNGWDILTEQQVGLETGRDFVDYESFLAAVKAQLCYLTNTAMDIHRCYNPYLHLVNPAPMMSPTYQTSAQWGKDIYNSGVKYNNTSIVGVGIGTLVDAILAVKQVVFDRKLVSFREFAEILKNNWEGQEKLRHLCKELPHKYGNNDSQADALTVELFELYADTINGKENNRGGVFRCGMFSVDMRLKMGKKVSATPDGRCHGESLSKNVAASLGQDKNGVTALLSSIAKMDGTKIPDGCVADVVLHHSAVKDEEGMIAFETLLKVFMKRGGSSVHFNVLSPEALKLAQLAPEKYQNLQVRLCGWNVRFVNLSKQEQDEFIAQAENKM